MDKTTVEARTAETILQTPYVVKAGDKEYKIARPTPATLIEVSKHIARLPKDEKIDENDVARYILSVASAHYPTLIEIATVLVCGAQPPTANPIRAICRKIRLREVRNALRYKATNEEVWHIISSCLSYQQIGFFLNNIISLAGANVTAPTKTGVTAHGD